MSDHEPVGADRLILLRHGRTEWNATGRFQGQADIPLDELGVEQARLAAETLRHEPIDQIWSSDLLRAHATATTVAERIGLPVRTSRELREIHVGSWEGLTAADLREIDPEFGERYTRGEDVRRSATGETTGEVGQRVAAELTRIATEAPAGATVLVGIHGLAALAGTSVLLGLPHEHWRALAPLVNCHWVDLRHMVRNRFAGGDRVWRLHAWNVGAPGAVDGERPVRDADARERVTR